MSTGSSHDHSDMPSPRCILFSLCLFAFTSLPQSTFAASYYVSPNGSGISCVNANPCSLNTGVGNAGAGDEVVLQNGVYTSGFTLSRSGSASAPIVIRAENLGGARFTGVTLTLSRNYWEIQGFIIEGSGVKLTGDHNRVSRNLFRNASGVPAVSIVGAASFSRVDYNEITNWNGYGVRLVSMQSGMTGNRIDHNYIHDNTKVSNAEAIQLGSGRVTTFLNPATLVEYNLLENIGSDEENEIISIKSSGNTLFANTFKESI